MTDYQPNLRPLEPAELQLLECVLNLVCQRRGLEKTSVEAENIAADLVQLYERGVRQEVDFGTLMS
ncbi:hypothetical protein RHAB21_02776 [Pseudorhizobium halotolerans]|uniref:Uncharacterized protein n=1 Tax=Pseudorhizobium halotolerans TaxID=1233081 RepID=A0ABN7JP58_9HYPH|nr:hypothetical protein [Pseudorhizobium halotolerans]CAD7038341.1 hypothetical protein RHAB21_02776 [Pseudorhizobium halotolerans]